MSNSLFNSRPTFVGTNSYAGGSLSPMAILDASGFCIGSRCNIDAFVKVQKNSSFSVLFGSFRTECAMEYIPLSGTSPIFIDAGVFKPTGNNVSSADIEINGSKSSNMSIIYGNKYIIRYPISFGNMIISKMQLGTSSSSSSSQYSSFLHVEKKEESKDFFSFIIYSVIPEKFNFNIKFEKLPLVQLSVFSAFVGSGSYDVIPIPHYLSFYDFIIEKDNWYLVSPKDMLISYSKKSEYSYYSNTGDANCFYINNFDSPILIFDYDVIYNIVNINKIDKPFYFDRHPEGMFKGPYNGFENDLNTDRDNIFFSFKSYIKNNNIKIDESLTDPYSVISIEPFPTYDPSSIFYASSKNKYFGNKVLVGKRRIVEINGMYGRSAPGSMNFINMQNIGISMIYDLFNHVSGKFINIKIVDDSEKIINSISDVGNLNLSGSQLKMIDQKEDVSFINLIGDVF